VVDYNNNMADKKFTEFPNQDSPLASDIILIDHDPDGSPATQKITLQKVIDLVSAGLTGLMKFYSASIADCDNTTDETTIFSITIPANDISDGNIIFVNIPVITKNNAVQYVGPTYKVKFAGTTMTVYSNTSANTGVNEGFGIASFIVMRVGDDLWCSAGSLYSRGVEPLSAGELIYNICSATARGGVVTAPDFTAEQTLELTCTLPVAHASLYVKPQFAKAYKY